MEENSIVKMWYSYLSEKYTILETKKSRNQNLSLAAFGFVIAMLGAYISIIDFSQPLINLDYLFVFILVAFLTIIFIHTYSVGNKIEDVQKAIESIRMKILDGSINNSKEIQKMWTNLDLAITLSKHGIVNFV